MIKRKTPPRCRGGASEFKLSVADKAKYGATSTGYQEKWIAERCLLTAAQAQVVAELAFGYGGAR